MPISKKDVFTRSEIMVCAYIDVHVNMFQNVEKQIYNFNI
jgi:hypothetical protein